MCNLRKEFNYKMKIYKETFFYSYNTSVSYNHFEKRTYNICIHRCSSNLLKPD